MTRLEYYLNEFVKCSSNDDDQMEREIVKAFAFAHGESFIHADHQLVMYALDNNFQYFTQYEIDHDNFVKRDLSNDMEALRAFEPKPGSFFFESTDNIITILMPDDDFMAKYGIELLGKIERVHTNLRKDN